MNSSHATHLPEEFGFKSGAEEFPLMILPQVSNICNSGCVHCWFNEKPELRKRDAAKYMSRELFRRIVDEVAERTEPRPLIRITGTGEPMLMPGLTDLMCYAAGEKDVRVAIISNGSRITPEVSARMLDAGVEAIELSVDAADRESYERVRRGLKWADITGNVEAMVEHRARTGAGTKILVSFVENEKEIEPDAVEAFWKGRVDNVIRRKYLTYGQLSEEGYSEETYLPPENRVPCPYPFERMVITADGNVTFCNFDVEDGYYMGNVGETSVAGVWRCEKYDAWRQIVLERRFEDMPLCCKCNDWKYKSWTHNFFRVLEKTDEADGEVVAQ